MWPWLGILTLHSWNMIKNQFLVCLRQNSYIDNSTPNSKFQACAAEHDKLHWQNFLEGQDYNFSLICSATFFFTQIHPGKVTREQGKIHCHLSLVRPRKDKRELSPNSTGYSWANQKNTLRRLWYSFYISTYVILYGKCKKRSTLAY
jgi:hypothetical protein